MQHRCWGLGQFSLWRAAFIELVIWQAVRAVGAAGAPALTRMGPACKQITAVELTNIAVGDCSCRAGRGACLLVRSQTGAAHQASGPGEVPGKTRSVGDDWRGEEGVAALKDGDTWPGPCCAVQTRVTPEEYKEFLSLGHGEIFTLDIDMVVNAPWRYALPRVFGGAAAWSARCRLPAAPACMPWGAQAVGGCGVYMGGWGPTGMGSCPTHHEDSSRRIPGVDYSDFFNFGLNPRTWKEYVASVQRFREEYVMQVCGGWR